jgi:hypothetical protein
MTEETLTRGGLKRAAMRQTKEGKGYLYSNQEDGKKAQKIQNEKERAKR